LGQNFWTRV